MNAIYEQFEFLTEKNYMRTSVMSREALCIDPPFSSRIFSHYEPTLRISELSPFLCVLAYI